MTKPTRRQRHERTSRYLSSVILLIIWQYHVTTVSNFEKTTPLERSLSEFRHHDSLDQRHTNSSSLATSYIYRKGSWDGAPIVIEEYRLLLFTVPKVGCTVLKQLCRKLNHLPPIGESKVHNPHKNGLRYLYHYSPDRAMEMLSSPIWMRAILTRDPKERLLSAYLDKGVRKNGLYVKNHCCARSRDCAPENFEAFLNITATCRDPHWMPQYLRMEPRFWEYINFVGHLETAACDVKLLLKQIGAWDEYGKTGWGSSGNASIFESAMVRHTTGSSTLLQDYYTPALEQKVEQLYWCDYEQLNLTLHKIEWSKSV